MSLDRSARGMLWNTISNDREIERATGKTYIIVRDAANGACLGMVSDQDVLAALQSVPGPDGKTPLPGSGAVSGLSIKDGKVYLSIASDPPNAPAREPMRAAAEAAVKKLAGVANALVSLTSEKQAPPKPSPPKPGTTRGLVIPGISHLIALASGKGGVGKSTTCVSLALGLASLGWRVGVLDADIYGPSVPRLLGLKGKPESEGRSILPLRAYGVKAMSIGFLVDEEEG